MAESFNISPMHRVHCCRLLQDWGASCLSDLWLHGLCYYSLNTLVWVLGSRGSRSDLIDLVDLGQRGWHGIILYFSEGHRAVLVVQWHPGEGTPFMDPLSSVILLIKLCLCDVFRINTSPSGQSGLPGHLDLLVWNVRVIHGC